MSTPNVDSRWDAPPKGYALSGKIMLSAIVILFVVVVFMVALHIYAKWYLLRVRRRYLHRRRSRAARQRATHIVFYVDPHNPNSEVSARGLDAAVLNSLPVFSYSAGTHSGRLECAVCLSEFEDNEKGRALPKCHHSFHIDCIDMWFESHSTCPLCRAPVEPDPVHVSMSNNSSSSLSDVVFSIPESTETEHATGSESAHGLCNAAAGTSSLADRRKGFDLEGVRIEVPRRGESEDNDGSRLSSPASHGFRSPGARLLSLKRILSMSRKSPALSPSQAAAGVGTSDIESGGGDESTQRETRVQTPRLEYSNGSEESKRRL